ncbi:MAG: metalloregulator ArsR/SmtB family transcription factor [Anaerolineae bacterium]|nr:metalloregulator ArsR/SmtB family transcription factor [Anaerolineae bacterium]
MAILTFDTLLNFLKTAGDETRLKIMCILSRDEYSVGDLAGALDLTAPTISHHLTKLREAGLVNLAIRGNTHYYQLNTSMIERMKNNLFTPKMMAEMGDHILMGNSRELFQQRAENARAKSYGWLDDLDISEEDRKVLRDYTHNGRLKQIPSKLKKRTVILRWLATKFAPGVTYTEREVNGILKAVHEDYVTLRRELYECGFLGREGGGGRYWRVEDQP